MHPKCKPYAALVRISGAKVRLFLQSKKLFSKKNTIGPNYDQWCKTIIYIVNYEKFISN